MIWFIYSGYRVVFDQYNSRGTTVVSVLIKLKKIENRDTYKNRLGVIGIEMNAFQGVKVLVTGQRECPCLFADFKSDREKSNLYVCMNVVVRR